jgi:hypothetical protein
MKLSRLAELKREIGKIMSEGDNDKDFPMEIIYSRGIEFPTYKIQIELVEEDVFIDSRGTKWVKAK